MAHAVKELVGLLGRHKFKALPSQSQWDSPFTDYSLFKRNTFGLQREVHILPGTTQPIGRRNNGVTSLGSFSFPAKEVAISGAWQEPDVQIPSLPCCGAGGLRTREEAGKVAWEDFLGEGPGRDVGGGHTHLMSMADIYLLLPALLFPQSPGKQRWGDEEIGPVRLHLGH